MCYNEEKGGEGMKESQAGAREWERRIRRVLPARARDTNKGDFGTAVLLCGSRAYPGAALLAAEGALRMGAGLTFLYAPEEVLGAARVRLPELICRAAGEMASDPAGVLSSVVPPRGRGALLIGCGIGQGDGSTVAAEAFGTALAALLRQEGAPVILDADALNLIARGAGAGRVFGAGLRRAVILTPHPLEFSRLTGESVAAIQGEREAAAARAAAAWGVTVVLKGQGTAVATPDGGVTVNPSGSPALAKGGTGDVLAGMLCGILAQGKDPGDAARAAVYLHGLAGERLAVRDSEYGVLPSALPGAAAAALAEICKKTRKGDNGC